MDYRKWLLKNRRRFHLLDGGRWCAVIQQNGFRVGTWEAMALPSSQCLYQIRGPKKCFLVRSGMHNIRILRCGATNGQEILMNYILYVIEMLRGSNHWRNRFAQSPRPVVCTSPVTRPGYRRPCLHMEQFENHFTKQVLFVEALYFFSRILFDLDVVGFWEFFEWTNLIWRQISKFTT